MDTTAMVSLGSHRDVTTNPITGASSEFADSKIHSPAPEPDDSQNNNTETFEPKVNNLMMDDSD